MGCVSDSPIPSRALGFGGRKKKQLVDFSEDLEREREVMEGMASVWGYQQTFEELQQTLLCTRLELESTLLAAKEERGRNEENVNKLLQLLKVAFQERDEAKSQLQRLLYKVMQLSPTEPCHVPPPHQTESPVLILPTKGNSSITESDSLSETYNHQSHVSSPVESFFDGVSSSELSNINKGDPSNVGLPNQTTLHENNGTSSVGIISPELNNTSSVEILSSEVTRIDPATVIIDQIAMKKPLPEKGKLLQAVVDAGPLLHNLLVAGPLPQFRNPPPVQSFQIPPVAIKGSGPIPPVQNMIRSPDYPVQSSAVESHHGNLNGAASCLCSSATLNFSSMAGPCMKKRPFSSPVTGGGVLVDQSLVGKRLRFQ